MLRSGVEEGISYSLSRWTDLPVTKWDWFKSCLQAGQMLAIDPRTAVPSTWSLAPADTLGLVFWTKNPENLIKDRHLLKSYRVAVHVTATGWEEVEKGAPDIQRAGELLLMTSYFFEKTYWRFSPIPQLPAEEVNARFQKLLTYASAASLDRVYVSFLQENDKMPETRLWRERYAALKMLEDSAKRWGVRALLCADDQSFGKVFPTGVCVPTEDFGQTKVEDCGCALMVDPFTMNETCAYGCAYCYASDKSTAPKKRNSTKRALVVL